MLPIAVGVWMGMHDHVFQPGLHCIPTQTNAARPLRDGPCPRYHPGSPPEAERSAGHVRLRRIMPLPLLTVGAPAEPTWVPSAEGGPDPFGRRLRRDFREAGAASASTGRDSLGRWLPYSSPSSPLFDCATRIAKAIGCVKRLARTVVSRRGVLDPRLKAGASIRSHAPAFRLGSCHGVTPSAWSVARTPCGRPAAAPPSTALRRKPAGPPGRPSPRRRR